MAGPAGKGQIELGIDRVPERDRNHHLGGRSFYFFDFDDNILFLTTPIIVFHKTSGAEIAISSGEWALNHHQIGRAGAYKDYEIRDFDNHGSFRHFRDHDEEGLRRLGARKQLFVEDVAAVLGFPDLQWKGPSWECFYHAAFNQRPVSVITARGHHPNTLADGIRVLVETRWLPLEPSYLSILPVTHPGTRQALGDDEFKMSVAELKQRAIRQSVELAIQRHGYSPHHRFGMSDDDPKNIQLIAEEMGRLKTRFPEMSFFLIETHGGQFLKHEVGHSGLRTDRLREEGQMSLFAKDPTEV